MGENKEFEQKLKDGYEEYLKLPTATFLNFAINEIFLNGWYIQTGFGIICPNPHRHYTFIEFVFFCGQKESLYNKFIKKK